MWWREDRPERYDPFKPNHRSLAFEPPQGWFDFDSVNPRLLVISADCARSSERRESRGEGEGRAIDERREARREVRCKGLGEGEKPEARGEGKRREVGQVVRRGERRAEGVEVI